MNSEVAASQLSEIVPAELLSRVERGTKLLENARKVRILCHYDPDGAAAAAILAKTLLGKGLEFHVSLSSVLDEERVAGLREEANDLTVIADMGSGQLNMLESLEGNIIVLDHHKPRDNSEKIVHINPHLSGVDGSRDLCGASLAWIFSIAADEANWNLAGIAMAGAIGDRQHVDGYLGLNETLFREAVERKILVSEKRLSLRDMPLVDSLSHSLSPYLVGLTGRRDACEDLLRGLKIDSNALPRKLDAKTRRALASILAIHLLKQGAQPEAMRTLVEKKFWIPSCGLYADELSALMNSCSRLRREGLGVSLAMGDSGAVREAEALREDFFNQVIRYLQDLEKGMFNKKYVQFFYCPEPTLAGAVAGIGMQYFFDGARPVIALSVLDKVTKVSSRGTRQLTTHGLDLAVALVEGAEAVGGHGGGHNIAAGASIDNGKEEKFLSVVDDTVGRQLKVKTEA